MMNKNIPDVVEVLINGGADMDARDIAQRTPLFVGMRNDFYQSVEELIARGSSIQVLDRRGLSALHFATKYKNLRMIKLLVAHKINIDVINIVKVHVDTFSLKERIISK